jgi:sec-independent protein translocase protein TatA
MHPPTLASKTNVQPERSRARRPGLTTEAEVHKMGLENPIHIIVILVVVLLVFGAKRLPEMGRSLGDGMRGFKDALSGASVHDSLPAVQATEMDLTHATSVPDTTAFAAATPAASGQVLPLHALDAVATVDSVPLPTPSQPTAA